MNIQIESIKPSKLALRAELDAHQAAYLRRGKTITELPGPTYQPKPVAPVKRFESLDKSRASGIKGMAVKTPEGMLSVTESYHRVAESIPSIQLEGYRSLVRRKAGPRFVHMIEKNDNHFLFTTPELVDEWISERGAKNA